MPSSNTDGSSVQGIALEGVYGMKAILDGRVAPNWNLEQHGFTLLQGKPTSIPLETFHSPASNHSNPLFKFSGSEPVLPSPGASSSDWTLAYYNEIAEACKSVAPNAEAVAVSYHVLRKADLSFSDGKYDTTPKDPTREAHKLAAKIVGSLKAIEFYPVVDQDRLFALLDGVHGSDGVEKFVLEMAGKAMPSGTVLRELEAQVIGLLRDDKAYNFIYLSREAFGNLVQKRKDVTVPAKDPDSQAHQVVSQILATYQYWDLFPKEAQRIIGSQLHLEGAKGVEAYLASLVEQHSVAKEINPHALMPGASAEVKAQVMSLLRDDTEHYDFVARSRRLVPEPVEEKSTESDLGSVAFQPPAVGGPHTDVSAEGFLNQFRGLIPESHEFGTPAPGRKRRVLFLKFWRNIAESPILNHHLAMLDKSSIDDSDIKEAEINFKGFSIKQNQFKGHVNFDKLRWVYFPKMQRDEVICFQQGDLTIHSCQSGEEHPKITFPRGRQNHATFHGAFEDPTAPQNASPRQSIECAAFVFLPEEPDCGSKL
jgi:hypothetical protein